MTIKDLNLKIDLNKRIKITNAPKKVLIGQKGTLTTPFRNYKLVGVFLDNMIKGNDTIDMNEKFEFEFTEEEW